MEKYQATYTLPLEVIVLLAKKAEEKGITASKVLEDIIKKEFNKQEILNELFGPPVKEEKSNAKRK